jgi:hypothetical protein
MREHGIPTSFTHPLAEHVDREIDCIYIYIIYIYIYIYYILYILSCECFFCNVAMLGREHTILCILFFRSTFLQYQTPFRLKNGVNSPFRKSLETLNL